MAWPGALSGAPAGYMDQDVYETARADGKKVLGLVDFHLTTARFLAKKLCICLVADNQPDSLITYAEKVWIDNRDKHDQIARFFVHIALSKEFSQVRAAKVNGLLS